MPGPVAAAVDPERRATLLGARLRGLVAGRWGEADRTAGRFPGGAALVEAASERVWVLAEEHGDRALGGALLWSARALPGAAAAEVHVILADVDAAAVVARQAALFHRPPSVWAVDGATLHPAVPAPPHVPAPGPAGVDSLIALLEANGVEVLLEHGSIVGAWRGLEIARVVVGDDARLEVGVGPHDREAFALVHGQLPAPEALAKVIDAVREQRSPTRPDSPFGRLARARWLRTHLVDRPELVGAARLVPVEPTVTPAGVKDSLAVSAVGEDADGRPIVVTAAVGIDPGAVPAGADARLAYAPDAELVVAVPARDRHPAVDELAAALRDPAEVRAVPVPWEQT